MTEKNVLKAMIDLSPVSMTQIAKTANVNKGNLSAWFTQGRSIGESSIERIEDILGIESGQLLTDRVYPLITNRDFTQLQHVLDAFFVEPQIMPVVCQRYRAYEFSELLDVPMAILVDAQGLRAVLIMKTLTSDEFLKNSRKLPWFSPEHLQGSQWLFPIEDGDSPFPTPLQVRKDIYQRWKKGEVTTESFDELMENAKEITWDVVLEQAKVLNLTPADLLKWLPLVMNAKAIAQGKESQLKDK